MNYSVIVPAHNEAAFLPGLLDSLCTQDFLPAEVVLVNDNSTDTTEEIMQTYAKKHPFVHYVNRFPLQHINLAQKLFVLLSKAWTL
jgi:glycosyltransferase involved in cell wall biosynthesis